MKVLWFALNGGNFSHKETTDIGRSWISSLQNIIIQHDEIELAIAFESSDDRFVVKENQTTYYPISILNKRLNKIKREFSIKIEEKKLIPHCIKIINDFKPDVIQCFGSEWCYGLISKYVDIPLVIHMQGSMPSYYNALYPPKYTQGRRLFYEFKNFHFKGFIRTLFEDKKSKERAIREISILQNNRNFMGRTSWDMAIVKLFSHDSHYFFCNEALRDIFLSSEKWKYHTTEKIILTTVGSGSLWKGLDVVLKTAFILKKYLRIRFEWHVIGGYSIYKYIEYCERKKFSDNNIIFLGFLDSGNLANQLLKTDLFVLPSYIENSPNVLCEAMSLGLPCIATDVGGVSSILKDGETGFLVPSNDPYCLAGKIGEIVQNRDNLIRISQNAIIESSFRHNPETIYNQIIETYNSINNNK